MTQRLTQCPHCKASFKVSEAQLSAANGRVRCGACMNIFDAIAYSLSSAQEPTNSSAEESESSQPVELENELLEDGDIFADNPEEDEREDGYSGSQKLSDEFSTSFMELDGDDTSKDPYSTSFKKLEDDFVSQDAVDESWTQNILDDIDTDSSNDSPGKKEPKLSDNPFEESISMSSDQTFDIEEQNETLDFQDDHSTPSYEKIDFQYQQDEEPKSRHWFVSLLFIIANIALLAVLLAQTSWYHYEKLARYPQVAALYEQVCAQLSCTLPKLEDITKIKSQNLVVRSHPTARKALIIDTVIINEAPFDQAFPNIAIYFSDINKKIVAQRLIRPNEYRNGELLSWSKMPADQPIHISLEIIDPGKQAVNYNLEFYPVN